VRGKIVRGTDAGADRAEIAWTATAEGKARKRPRKIRNRFQSLTKLLTQARVADEIGDGV